MVNNFFTSTGSSIPFSQLKEKIKDNRYIGNIDTKPPYQREYIWTNRFKRDLIISILKGYPIGVIIVRQKLNDNLSNNNLEVIDGQQRLKTLNEFLNNKLKFNGTHTEIAREVIEKMGYKIKKQINSFDDFPEELKRNFERGVIQTQVIISNNDEEVRNYFYLIQNQEKLKAGEIIEAFPETHFDNLFIKYEKEIELFNKKIKYFNNRKEFLKILFSILAFENNDLPLGTLDELIIKYVRNFTNDNLKKKNNLDMQKIYENFELQLKKLNKLEKEIDVGIAKKRFIKLALLFLNRKPINSFFDWDKLALLNKFLSEYNSTKWRNSENENINKLLESKIIENEKEYKLFEELYNTFVGSKTKSNTDELLNFWVNKF